MPGETMPGETMNGFNVLGLTAYYASNQLMFFVDPAPRLAVSSLARSLEFYERALGFDQGGEDQRGVVVTREGASLILCEGARQDARAHDGNCPWDVLVWVSDCQSLWQEYRWRNAGPVWHGRNMQLIDPDEYVLLFAQGDTS
jgi:hypothetical protein